jgi:MFS family permease
MVGTRLLTGLAAATALTIGITLIGDLADENLRNRYMGLNVSFAVFAAVLTTPLAGLLGDISWRLPFFIFSLSLPLVLVAYYGLASKTVRAAPVHTAAAAVSAATSSQERMFIPYVFMILALCAGIVSFVVPIYMPFQFRDIGINSSTTIALSITALSIVSATTAAFFGAARRVLSSQMAFAFSFTCGAIGLVLAAFMTSLPIIFVGLMIAGLGNGWLAPNVMARAAAAATPTTRGRIVGLVKGAHMSASFVSVLLLEPISRAHGPKGALATIAVLAITVAVICAARHFVLRSASQAQSAAGA